MSTNYKLQEMLTDIRKVDESIERIKIKNVKISKQNLSVHVNLINDKSVSEQVKNALTDKIKSYMPNAFGAVTVDVKKVKADKDLVELMVFDYVQSTRKYLIGAIKKEDFCYDTQTFTLNIALSDREYDIFKGGKIFDDIKEFLNENFCEPIKMTVSFRSERESDFKDEQADETDFERIKLRTLKVENVRSYISYDTSDVAVYIADAVNLRSAVTVCGIITEVRKRTNDKGKDWFLISFTDKTGNLSGHYFPKKDKVKFVEALKEGDGVIFDGEMEEYNGRPSYRINNIGLCDFPADFVPERKEGKKAPANYKKIFPQELQDATQINVFKQDDFIPDCLMGKTFVVFDVETTGLDVLNDRITEIGAVKIVDGEIKDCFTTLINPQVNISEKITSITGITNEMVADKPVFSEICADFYKYVENAVLVAHNANFDISMMKNHYLREGYYLENSYLDTLEISRNTLKGLKNYQLNTVCDYFEIQFLHHRALSDAHATAKLFIELIKLKKCLPF